MINIKMIMPIATRKFAIYHCKLIVQIHSVLFPHRALNQSITGHKLRNKSSYFAQTHPLEADALF